MNYDKLKNTELFLFRHGRYILYLGDNVYEGCR